MPSQASAPIGGRDADITASVDRRSGDDGVLFATGTENSGISLFVQDDRLVLDYNAFDDHSIIESDIEVPAGSAELAVQLRRGNGMAGSAALLIDGAECARAELPLYMRMISSVGSSIGRDHGSAVSSRYEGPFEFSGTLHEVVIQLSPERMAAAQAAEARAEMSRQ
jgi:arylsulfatase